MINQSTEKSLLHGCFTRECATQQPPQNNTTGHATTMQQASLKAMSLLVLERNNLCNKHATSSEKDTQQAPQNRELKVEPVAQDDLGYTLAELDRERRRTKVLEMLGDKLYAVLVEDASTDPVIVTIAKRGVATFELAIPHHSYNDMVLLGLIERHTTRETLQ